MEEDEVEYEIDLRSPIYTKDEYGPWKKFLHEKPFFNSEVLTTKKQVTPKGKEKWGDLKAYTEPQLQDLKNTKDLYWIYPPSEYKRLGDVAKRIM